MNSCLRDTPEEGSDEVRQIRAFSAGGRDLGALTGCRHRPLGPDWTADGSRLGYTLVRRIGAPPFVTITADGGDLSATGVENSRPPVSFSPDGRRVVFERDDELWIARTDGSGERKFLGRSCTDDCAEFKSPRWSPDGGRIAFEAFVVRAQSGVTSSGIWIVGARRGKGLRRVSKNGHEIDWAPDGKRLVFRSRYSLQYRTGRVSGGNLVVVGAKGRSRRVLVHTKTTAAVSPAWSPDGRSIAYVDAAFTGGQESRDYRPRLKRVPARGGRTRTLAKLPDYSGTDFEYIDPEISWRPRPRR